MKKKHKPFSTRLPEELIHKLRMEAARRKLKMQDLVTELIENQLKKAK